MDEKAWKEKIESGEFLIGNVNIKGAIEKIIDNPSEDNAEEFALVLVERMLDFGQLIVPIETCEDDHDSFIYKTVVNDDGSIFFPAFTDQEEFEKGPDAEKLYHFIDALFEKVLETDEISGVVINPWGDSFELSKDLIEKAVNAKNEQESTAESEGLLDIAVMYAVEKYAGKRNSENGRPYIMHPLEVMTILNNMKADTELAAAGVLHDIIENADDITLEDIALEFGDNVALLLCSTANDKSNTWHERKSAELECAGSADVRKRLLILADAISDLRSMYAEYKAIGARIWEHIDTPKEQLSWYYSELQDALSDMQSYIETEDFYWEMVGLYKDIFVTFLYDEKEKSIYQFNSETIFKLTKSYPHWEEYDEETDGKIPERAVFIKRKRAESIEDNWMADFILSSTILN